MTRRGSVEVRPMRQRFVRCVLVLLTAVAIATASALFSVALETRAQGSIDDDILVMVAAGTAVRDTDAVHSCVTLDSAANLSIDDATYGLLGFCTYGVNSGGTMYTHIKTFWNADLPDGVETMKRLAYMYIYSGVNDLDTLTNRQAGLSATWSVCCTSRLELISGATHAYQATAPASSFFRITQPNDYTLLLTSVPIAVGTPDTPTELRATANEDFTERTITWAQNNIVEAGEMHRQELLSSDVGSNFFGNDAYFKSADGVDVLSRSFVDDTVNASVTYRYRVRLTSYGGDYSLWSEFIISNELPRDDVSAVPAVMYPRPDQERFTLADDGSPRGYQFEIIGEDAAWPVQVAIQGDSFRLSASLQTVADCTGLDDTLSIERDAREFYLYVCETGDATLLLRSGVDGQLYADYPLFTAATTVAPRPDQPPGELFVDRSGEDHLGITGALEQLFEHTAMDVDPVLAKNFLVLVLTVGIGAVPLLRRGRMDVPALTNGFILASLVMWGATIVAGYPIWWAVTPSALLVSVGIIGFASRLRAGR